MKVESSKLVLTLLGEIVTEEADSHTPVDSELVRLHELATQAVQNIEARIERMRTPDEPISSC